MPLWLCFVLVGLTVGSIAGMLGIGGGVLIIPALVFLFAFPQKLAVGTSLAMLLPPIGIFALLPYWLLAAGFAVGGYFGGWFANRHFVSERFLRVLFAFFMLYVAGNMLFRSEDRVRAALKTTLIMLAFALTYAFARMLGRRLETRLNLPETYRSKLGAPLTPDYEI